MLLIFLFLKKNNINAPTARIGSEYAPTSKPIMNAVIVVPILAPIITPIACRSVINPALTKLTVITVVPELLWIRTVTRIPARTPISGLVVNLSRISRNLSPADLWSPSPIDLIPNRNIPNPPIKEKISSCTFISKLFTPKVYNLSQTRLLCLIVKGV